MPSSLACMRSAVRTTLDLENLEKASVRAIVTRALEPFQEQVNDRLTIDGHADLWLDLTKSITVGWPCMSLPQMP